MDLSELERIRVEKIERMRAAGIDAYPTRAEVSHTTAEACRLFEEAEKTGPGAPLLVTVGGRIRSTRLMGKLGFAHIEDGTGRLQLFLRVNELGEAEMERFRTDFDLGDFIQASGTVVRTRTGEISVQVAAIKMLAKAITPLPAAKDELVDGQIVRHAALTDPETRYRQRYADLAVNPEVREIFRARSKTVKSLRAFLDNLDFLEVETPILQPIYGGAAAQPFVTYHNQLKQNLYLRISFELYLKRLLVGGLDRVYEIGRDFRNEGVSFKHNPEFTQLEFYMAYADYLKVMEITEQMVSTAAQQVTGAMIVSYDGKQLDFTPPWRRLELRQGILDTAGIDIDACPSAESLADAMTAKGIHFKPGTSRGKLIDSLLGDFLEPTLIQPTFLYNYPRDISPLAKSIPGNTQTVERFEGYVAGMELCNAFTELNDPLDQEQRFLEMGREYETGDDERHPMDSDYLQAMSYGMPPCGGFGMGVDRLAMLLSDRKTIREVLLFPHLRGVE